MDSRGQKNGATANVTDRVRDGAVDSFAMWLRSHRPRAEVTGLPDLVREFGGNISLSSAYRIAVRMGAKGRRHNRSRYDEFWEIVNWDLPDSVLSELWGVARGNLRQRRVRLGKGKCAFNVRNSRHSSDFKRQVQCEEGRARNYDGPRPR
jgi:hypothetical protein